MSTTSTGGRARPSTRCGSSSRSSSCQLSGRGVARPADQQRPRVGGPPPRHLSGVIARVALPACRRNRAPHRSRSGRDRVPARRRLSVVRRRFGPPRSAGAATRRTAPPAGMREWSSATESPNRRRRKRSIVCGVRAISGTSTIAPRPRGERLPGGLQVHLGLPRTGHRRGGGRTVWTDHRSERRGRRRRSRVRSSGHR